MTSSPPSIGLNAKLDALYRGPLDAFTRARNELSKTLKTNGDAESASMVKALKKPSLSAWAVNQFYWHCPDEFAELLHAGDQLRLAQRRSLSGGDLADVEEARRRREQAIVQARGKIDGLLKSASHGLTATIERRIATSLDAIASFGTQNPDPVAGRLTEDLEPPGFAALAALAARPVVMLPPKERPLPDLPATNGIPERAGNELAPPRDGARETSAEEQARRESRLRAEKDQMNAVTELRRAEKEYERKKTQHQDAERARTLAEVQYREASQRFLALEQALALAEEQYVSAKSKAESIQERIDTLKEPAPDAE